MKTETGIRYEDIFQSSTSDIERLHRRLNRRVCTRFLEEMKLFSPPFVLMM